MTEKWTDDERTDTQKNSVALAHLTKRESDVASLVEFQPVV